MQLRNNIYASYGINYITSGKFSIFAGSGKNELKEGVGTSACIGSPTGITVDQKTGNVYVASFRAICVINPQGIMSCLLTK